MKVSRQIYTTWSVRAHRLVMSAFNLRRLRSQ